MTLSNLTLILTDECNFNCDYCVRGKVKSTMGGDTLEEAVDFFYPLLRTEGASLGFYGGEPLLTYDRIIQAVRLVEKRKAIAGKKIQYVVTTNGSLLTPDKLEFFNRHRFALTLSFDGLAQDLSRKVGTMDRMSALVRKMPDYGHIDFEINSVFTPRTVHLLSGSMRFLIEYKGPVTGFNLNSMEAWSAHDIEVLQGELDGLIDFLVRYYRRTGLIPVKNFRPSPDQGVFACGAGKDRMAVSPGGTVWGCFLFHDFFAQKGKDHPQYSDFCFGQWTDFVRDYPGSYQSVVDRCGDLRQDFFQVGQNACFLCRDMAECVVCPVNAAFSSGTLGQVSCGHCNLKKVERAARSRFLDRIAL